MKNLRNTLYGILTVVFALTFIACPTDTYSKAAEKSSTSGFSVLYQLPNATSSQMMGYVIKTSDGHVIVIDGGTRGDAFQLTQLLMGTEAYGTVDAWFITHPHGDHIDALVEIIENHPEIYVRQIFASMLDLELIQRYDPLALAADGRYHLFLEQNNYTELFIGDRFVFGDVAVEVLAVKNPEITRNIINNSSCVLKVTTRDIGVLFLADLNLEGGQSYLTNIKVRVF